METVKDFFASPTGSGSGNGCGCGCGNGSGSGSGDGRGYGDSYGYGRGDGCGRGNGCGYGCGTGTGTGDGYGCGTGYGYGYGYGLKSYNGEAVYRVDRVPTIIRHIAHGFALGAIVNNDLTLTRCWIVKGDGYFAHGETLKKARAALLDKIFDDKSEEERIAEFWKCHNRTDKYSGRDLWHWHHRLTGSCEMGRDHFAAEHGIDIDNSAFTVAEFIALCENDYGGGTIRKLKEGGRER